MQLEKRCTKKKKKWEKRNAISVTLHGQTAEDDYRLANKGKKARKAKKLAKSFWSPLEHHYCCCSTSELIYSIQLSSEVAARLVSFYASEQKEQQLFGKGKRREREGDKRKENAMFTKSIELK